jgi:hypothetical protein
VPERRCARDSPGVGAALRGKFWDTVPELEGDLSDREVDSVGEERWSEGFSPRRLSARSTLEGFITRAEELGGAPASPTAASFRTWGKGIQIWIRQRATFPAAGRCLAEQRR